MKRFVLLVIATSLALSAFGQQEGQRIFIEALSKPTQTLSTQTPRQIYEEMILDHLHLSRNDIAKQGDTSDLGIVAMGDAPKQLVNFGTHSFLQGMYRAYAEHYPFVLSPDMIWLLISQGFATHVDIHAEELRSQIVDHSEKISLIIMDNRIRIDDPNAPWEKLFPQFADSMRAYTKNGIIDLLTADFSTTTPTSRIASQITVMKAMENYFEYIYIYAICGIPEVTLLGTPEDWQKILDKTRQLARYNLSWWVDEMVPVLEKIVETSKGKIDRNFWRSMFKIHDTGPIGCGSGNGKRYFDGWIVKFFPYDNEGNRNDLHQIEDRIELPDEIVKTDLKYQIILPNGAILTIPLELWAGFIGLEQDPETFALTPTIGWMIRKKEQDQKMVQQMLSDPNQGEISIRVKHFPNELLSVPAISSLSLTFIDKIEIPDELAQIKISDLSLYGQISSQEKKRLIQLFANTNTRLQINQDIDFYYKGQHITKIGELLPSNNPKFRHLADSLLSVHIGPDFHQVFQYQGALSRIVSYYDFNTLLGETFSDSTNILNKEHIFVQYRLKRADGKPIKMYTLTMSFDSTEHENISPILYDSLDFTQLRYMYNVLSKDSLLSKKEAIAKLHEQLPNAKYTVLRKQCIYNSLTHRFEWILDGDIVIKQKTASKTSKVTYSLIRLDAITGEILYTGDRSYLYKLYLLPSYFLSEYTIPTFIDQN